MRWCCNAWSIRLRFVTTVYEIQKSTSINTCPEQACCTWERKSNTSSYYRLDRRGEYAACQVRKAVSKTKPTCTHDMDWSVGLWRVLQESAGYSAQALAHSDLHRCPPRALNVEHCLEFGERRKFTRPRYAALESDVRIAVAAV